MLTSKVAAQMYTVREHTKTAADLASTLEKIAQIGYPAVQMSGIAAMNGDTPEVSALLGRKMLDDNGLKCIATHRPWDLLVNQTEREIEFHEILGCGFTAIGGLPGEYSSLGEAGFRQFLVDSQRLIDQLKASNIWFGYHNHDSEFQRYGFRDGIPLTNYDIFIDEGGPDFLLEIDVYWVSHGGVNPERVVERAAGRMPVIHIKDKEVSSDGPRMAPIGEGNLDWANLLPACEKAGVEWYAVEQDDCYRDPFDCLKSSFDYLSRLSL